MPQPRLKMVGEDGNAWAILARARKTLRKTGESEEEVQKYLKEARAGDYNHLIQTTMRWFDTY